MNINQPILGQSRDSARLHMPFTPYHQISALVH